jgi:hypothetical protein
MRNERAHLTSTVPTVLYIEYVHVFYELVSLYVQNWANIYAKGEAFENTVLNLFNACGGTFANGAMSS